MSRPSYPALADAATKRLFEILGQERAIVVRAPGRVNLIGEHTDYNHGFVLPMAINRHTSIVLVPTDDDQVELTSLTLEDDTRRFDLASLNAPSPGRKRRKTSWIEYARGVARALAEARIPVHGFRGVVVSDLPQGAGLSSSASFELAVARAFVAVAEDSGAAVQWDPETMAHVAWRAEHEWVGVACGIMDQLVCAAGLFGHALSIDCRSLAIEYVPMPETVCAVILDTGTRRRLSGSPYNNRRDRCLAAARTLGLEALRDIRPDELEARADELDATSLRRARHVVTENQRTVAAAEALRRGDVERVGALMDQSHESLMRDFKVSSQALDAMVEHARRHPGCLGARLTGAGFAGCAVALVEARAAEEFALATIARYIRGMESGVFVAPPQAFICKPADGAARGQAPPESAWSVP